jgi:hypothetical protein
MQRATSPSPGMDEPRGLARVEPLVHEGQAALAGWGVRARRFIRDNPGKTLLGAVALGFVVAKVARHA